MIRLDARDLSDPARLSPLAGQVKMTPEAFRERFAYLTK
jgi:hypothetical protein